MDGKEYIMTFMHMDNFEQEYKVGMTLSKGSTIGKIGSTGRSKGNHPHFQVSTNNGAGLDSKYIIPYPGITFIDPVYFLNNIAAPSERAKRYKKQMMGY